MNYLLKFEKIILCFAAVLLSFLLNGCAHQPWDNIKEVDYIYKSRSYEEIRNLKFDPSEISILARESGAKSPGFVGFDDFNVRNDFESKYPIVKPEELDFKNLDGQVFSAKLGFTLTYLSDMSPQSAAFLKDKNGRPISVSGRFEFPLEVMGARVTTGVAAGLVSGAVATQSINNQLSSSGARLTSKGETAVMGGNIAGGVLTGVLAGAVDGLLTKSAIDGVVASKDFGEMMGHARFLNDGSVPRLGSISRRGSWHPDTIYIAPGVVVKYYIREHSSFNYKRDYILVSAVGTFRGNKYRDRYPETLGWEFRVTNMILINSQLGGDRNPLDQYNAIRHSLYYPEIFKN